MSSPFATVARVPAGLSPLRVGGHQTPDARRRCPRCDADSDSAEAVYCPLAGCPVSGCPMPQMVSLPVHGASCAPHKGVTP